MGTQIPWPEHALQSPQAPQAQLPAQVRTRERLPQVPQASTWVSSSPGAQTPSPPQDPQDPHSQEAVQVWVWVPQLPQAWVPVSPGPQIPWPVHAPQEFQLQDALHVRVWDPQSPQPCVPTAPGLQTP